MSSPRSLIALAGSYLVLIHATHGATFTWDGSVGNWTDNSKWSPTGDPSGSSADVVVDSGSLTLNSSRTIDELDLDDALITATAATTLRLNGPLTWTGTGRFGGVITVIAEDGITLSGSGTKVLGEFNGGAATLINNDVANLSGGNLSVAGEFGSSLPGSELINNGTWNFTSSAGVFSSTSGNRAGTFTNHGTVNKTGSANAQLNVTFDNHGAVNVSGGRLLVSQGESDGGSYSASGSGTLAFNGAREFGSGDSISGNGTIEFAGLDAVIDGANYNVTGTTLVTREVEFKTNVNLATLHLDASSGQILGDGDVDVVDLIWEYGAIETEGDFTVSGSLDLSQGGNLTRNLGDNTTTILTSEGTVDHSRGDLAINNRGSQFINRGTYVIESSSDITDGTGGGVDGRFLNEGTFNKADNGTSRIECFFDNSDEVNISRGTLEIREGGTDLSGDYHVTDAGELEFEGGTRLLDLFASIDGDGEVTFSGANVTFDPESSFLIDHFGTTNLTGGTVTFNTQAPAETDHLVMSGGTRSGSSSLVANRSMTWSGGTLASGATTYANDLSLTGGGLKTLGTGGGGSGAMLIHTGNGTMSGGGNLSIAGSSSANPGSSFINRGTFEITDGSGVVGVSHGGSNGGITNDTAGLFTKSGAGTTTAIGVAFTNRNVVRVNGGTLSFGAGYTQTSGALTLGGGTVSSTTPLAIQGGSLGGSGTISGDTAMSGTLAPGASAGLIDFTGDLALGASSKLQMEIGGTARGSGHDAFDVTGGLTLAGELQVSFIGGYLPAGGESFILWTAGSTTGAFTSVSLPALSGDLSWDTSQLAASGILSVSDGGGGFANYAEFAAAYTLAEGPSGDDDGDGLENFIEYLLGSLPDDPTSAPRMSLSRSGTTTTVSITVPETVAAGVSQLIESSSSLLTGSWEPVVERPAGGGWQAPATLSEPVGGYVELRVEVIETVPRNFYRFGGSEAAP
ncbi:beta strand repeat-containing protein [Haloferula sargassicola]|uniref:Autotransporter-associated beta strand repeat protein n=1 Tax=Haloferula sargassicola TaxID=490096 RepID=A0ABP9URL0_9BACT